MSRLGAYLGNELNRRNWSPEEFGRRSGLGTSHVYQIIRGQKSNIRQATVDRIADGLGMTVGELMTAVEAQTEPDPIEQMIHARVAEMREAVRDTPRQFWPTIIRATFDQAINGAHVMASLLANATDNTANHGTTDVVENDHSNGGSRRRKPEIKSGNLVFEPSL